MQYVLQELQINNINHNLCVITDNVMVGTQLGKDMIFGYSSPENINYDKIYVMSFLWSSMDLFDLLCLTQYISYIMATSFSGGRSRSTP
jgi:hypothetical protein